MGENLEARGSHRYEFTLCEQCCAEIVIAREGDRFRGLLDSNYFQVVTSTDRPESALVELLRDYRALHDPGRHGLDDLDDGGEPLPVLVDPELS